MEWFAGSIKDIASYPIGAGVMDTRNIRIQILKEAGYEYGYHKLAIEWYGID